MENPFVSLYPDKLLVKYKKHARTCEVPSTATPPPPVLLHCLYPPPHSIQEVSNLSVHHLHTRADL